MWCSPLGGPRSSSIALLLGPLAALSLSLTACPASLANPEDFADRTEFPAGGGSGTAGSTSSGAGTANTTGTPDCVLAIFKAGSGTCSGSICHDQGVNSAGGLDLASPNVAGRLVDQPAPHSDIGPSDVCPTGDKLIDTSDRSASWLLKKLSASTVGTCGDRMPDSGNLTSIQLSCLQNWINEVQPGGT
jgi:predicted CxxxxCH...CXXCH cytochrome family protein